METLAEFCARLSPLPLPEEMRQWDAEAAALGLSPAMLMENAGHVALDVLLRYCPDVAGKAVWLIMGSGNNGGDAACIARLLADRGARPLLFTARPPEAAAGASALHLSLARANGVRVIPLPELTAAGGLLAGGCPPPRLIVDGLLGTGFSGTLRPDAQAAIEQVNALSGRTPSCFVLAVDIPSGLDATSGKPSPVAVRAHATVSLAAAKPGLVLPDAAPWVGALHVGDIGMPAPVRAPVRHCLLDGRALSGLPAPAPESHKNSFGHVLVLGGAPGLSGAGHMACAAALRTGAGLVSAAAPQSALAAIQGGWPEIMTVALGPRGAVEWPAAIEDALLERLRRATALAVGPGMGRGEDAAAFLAALLQLPERPPAVIDADALVLLSRRSDLLAKLGPDDVLTPHPGEAAALLGTDGRHIQADRPAALAGLCALSRAAVVLKGAGTLVGQASAPVFISPYAVPALAMGGSGDVLAGCISALLAQSRGHEAAGLRAAATGVVLHALAGRSLGRGFPRRGCLASELADALPHVCATLGETRQGVWERRVPWPC
ncbi:NAD(P)H-hydrate dehydratase [Desulfovibrio sp.]|uniref:NAD(P)H-hydrate dehydratase n=1 Tax=Desulfovibrio sp. TaxID=885 RepID=UPI0023CD256B|nr:NAD(P)H-hydrate dehydratase [Desulfovibrio sp.]MDE7240688.1 NAD(P)H-hydrate dehydratase [Desulfovibrio sp.]